MKPQDEIVYLKERIKTLEKEVLEEMSWYEEGFNSISANHNGNIYMGKTYIAGGVNDIWIGRFIAFPTLVKAVVDHVNAPLSSGRDPLRRILEQMDIQCHKDGIGGCFYR